MSKTFTDINDKSEVFLNSFIQDASTSITEFDKKIKDVEEIYDKLCAFYGENTKELPYEQFFEIFNKFFKEITVTKEKVLIHLTCM